MEHMGAPAPLTLLSKTPVDYAALADEWGELRRRIDLLKPDQARIKAVEALLQPLLDLQPADMPMTLNGLVYQLQVSPCEHQTKINDIAEVRRAMTAAAFLEIVSVTLKALKPVVSEFKFLQLTTTARTGSRSIKAVRTSAAA